MHALKVKICFEIDSCSPGQENQHDPQHVSEIFSVQLLQLVRQFFRSDRYQEIQQ